MRGQLFIGEDITQDHDVQCDVCIVGSGAGGAVLAAGLVSSGLKVVMLEEGGYYDQDNFKLNEGDAYFNLYQDRGTRATSDVSITVLQGRTVGGSTTVNWTTCFRTPDRILKHWEQNFGTEAITTETLKPHFEEVERRLGIQEWPLDRVNANNKVLVDGCKKLGYEVRPLRRNVRSCADSGFCGMGCPIGAKQAMHRTYIQDALDDFLEDNPGIDPENSNDWIAEKTSVLAEWKETIYANAVEVWMENVLAGSSSAKSTVSFSRS